MSAPSWISQEKPDVLAHLTSEVQAILTQVANESKDKSSYLYTQAEVVRAVEIAISKSDPLDDAIENNGGRFTI